MGRLQSTVEPGPFSTRPPPPTSKDVSDIHKCSAQSGFDRNLEKPELDSGSEKKIKLKGSLSFGKELLGYGAEK